MPIIKFHLPSFFEKGWVRQLSINSRTRRPAPDLLLGDFMTWLLDPTQPMLLRAAVSVLLATQLIASTHQIVVAASGQVVNAVVACSILFGAVGLYRRVCWGRFISLVFVWGVALAALGSINPFRAVDDLAAGLEPPSIIVLVAQLALVFCYALWCGHVLNKYRSQFRGAWI